MIVRDLGRELAMVERFRNGETLASIGAAFGISRQRVEQLLSRHGLSRKDGGAAMRGARRRVATQRARDATYVARFGVPFAEYKTICAAGGNVAYREQKRNAKERGVAWQFTLASWWKFWQDSGRWQERGRWGDAAVMARFNDVGPYSPTNVYITTLRENSRDCQMNLRARRELLAA